MITLDEFLESKELGISLVNYGNYGNSGNIAKCNAIKLANKIINKYPNKKKILILSNYDIIKYDEILEYIIKNKCIEDEKLIRNKNKKKYIEYINDRIETLQYIDFYNILLTSKDIKKTIEELTKDRIIIVEQIINYSINRTINIELIKNIIKDKNLSKLSSTINYSGLKEYLLRLFTKLANKSSKIILLEEITSSYNNFLIDLREVVSNLFPDLEYDLIEKLNRLKLNKLIENRTLDLSTILIKETSKPKKEKQTKTTKKECPDGKILNPKTKRCVKIDGLIAKRLNK